MISICRSLKPKRYYYYVSPLGRRLFQLALGPAALAFIAAGAKDDLLRARQLIKLHGDRWTVTWLRHRELDGWADYLDRLHQRMETPAATLFGDHRKLPLNINGRGILH